MLYIILVLCIVLCVSGKHEEYKGYQVYNIHLKTAEQQKNLHLLKSDGIDFWKKPSQKYGVVGKAMVPSSHRTWFEDKLKELGVEKQIAINDVFEYLSETEEEFRNANTSFDFDGYYRYDKIIDYMKAIERSYENSTDIDVKLVENGTTDEGRPLVYFKIGNPTRNNPVVIIEAGINPREWITVPAALNVVDKVIQQRRFLDGFDWIIIPVVNPDGYEYTHTNLRLWAKNRSVRSNLGTICPGVNINRNFDIDWQISDSSTSPCSHLYAGTEAFSEPETRFIRSLHMEYSGRLQLYISLQNTGGFIAYPWQYERAASGMFRQHYLLGTKMVDAMGGDYNLDIGSLAFGDRASGTSTDYLTLNGVLYAFNIDVQDQDVHVDDVKTVVDKVWRGIAVAAESFLE
ncbi:carboxypeptidase B-like [Pieris brassicae]|uniref:Peptidase M14 domain-containing protein n=1 Tax=Pieris brassicae TaxID=7116 RepID=A0A9P0X629_PIEBR|nr:carboxypeptidase B-like [Pieris brassicae]CAH4000590.1 unnamed protein product [Pieris brassicae]